MRAGDKRQRRQRGSAWHWKQTDAWYYTPPGTKRRIPLMDENGQRIRGPGNRQVAELALARLKVAGQWRPPAEPSTKGEWLVAQVCSEYLEYSRRGVTGGTISAEYCSEVVRRLNQLCEYCGALPVSRLTKGHVQLWVESQPTWRSPATRRNTIAIVLAAFNYARNNSGVPHALQGLKKPVAHPRLQSFSPEEEATLYAATDEPFGNFLFAAIHTGLRPFCELARLTAENVEETERGMLWRVYSSKTKKTRKIPVRSDVAELTRQLMQTAAQGSGVPLLRNTQGNAWKKVTGVSRFSKIKQVLGWKSDPVRKKYSCYTCRHTFAHRMLAGYWNGGAGCSIETLAHLLGDTPKVAFDHYGREWGQHYQEPLWAAIGVRGGSPSSGSPSSTVIPG
jgi:integrase